MIIARITIFAEIGTSEGFSSSEFDILKIDIVIKFNGSNKPTY